MKKIMLGTSDAWSMSCSSQRPSKPAYYIEDCRISGPLGAVICHNNLDAQTFNDCQSRCYHLNSPCKCFSEVEIVIE